MSWVRPDLKELTVEWEWGHQVSQKNLWRQDRTMALGQQMAKGLDSALGSRGDLFADEVLELTVEGRAGIYGTNGARRWQAPLAEGTASAKVLGGERARQPNQQNELLGCLTVKLGPMTLNCLASPSQMVFKSP